MVLKVRDLRMTLSVNVSGVVPGVVDEFWKSQIKEIFEMELDHIIHQDSK